MLDAITKAKSTGRPVAVETLTNEVSVSVANPDGTLTTTDNAQPVRTKRGGVWADLDPSLRVNADGTLSPTVATIGLTFSGGGTGPMATVTTEDGKSLAISAPFTLPKPTVNGAVATYPGVLPGVDLQLTALDQGGWRDVIIVRTKEAAESPALKSLSFPIAAHGLTVTTDQAGAISVTDDHGGTRFRSPVPLQWDSSKPPAESATSGSRASRASTRTALAAAPAVVPNEGTTGTLSNAEEPGDGANVAAIATKVTPSSIELTPDQEALGAGDGPWYLDPSVAAASYTQGSVEVQENHKDAKNYNLKSNVATGYCGYHSSNPSLDCGNEGRQRAYFQFNINPAIYTVPQGADFAPTIQGATLNAQVTGASSPGTNTPFVVYSVPRSKSIGTGTSWYDQPCGDNRNVVMDGCSPVDGQWLTGTGPLAINVTGAITSLAADKQSTWTIGIAPQASEWEKLYRHYLANNPSIATTYDVTPTVWYPRTIPAPGFANTGSTAECTSGGTHPWDNPGWIGSSQNIYVRANSWSPTGQSLYTGFHMWDDNDPNFSWGDGDWGGNYNDPGIMKGAGSLADGHQYGWYAQSADGTLTSPMSAWCYFRVDRTNPRLSISSTDFPPSGTPNDHPTRYAGDSGSFTINAEDPAPGNGLQASGIACVRFSADSTPVVGWQCGQSGTYAPGAPVPFTPRNWGTNIVYAWAMDVAGNYSQPAAYSFYAPWKPGTQPLFGDVDNDQKPDIVIADAKGDLRIIGGIADPANSLAAPATSAPGNRDHGTTWADFQLSHHGTFAQGQAVDQIIAHYNKDTTSALNNALYLIPNNGTGRYDNLPSIALNRPTACTVYGTGVPCPDYTQKIWSNVSQVVAIGTPDGEAVGADPDPANTDRQVMMSQTSILTLEKNNLYLFQPGGLAEALDTAMLIPTTADGGSWADYELLTPGAANGATAIPGTTDPTYQTTVWARHRTNGNIYSYALTWKEDGTVDYSSLAKPDAGFLILSGAGWTTTAQPKVGAGDLNNDGYPDVWAINTSNAITVFPGKSSAGTKNKVDGFNPEQVLGYADASVSIRPSSVGWQCADAEGGARDGATLAIWGCWTTANQRFNFAADGTIRAGGYCVSTKDDALWDGAAVVLARCEGKNGQKWAMRPDGRIYLPATVDAGHTGGRCLELPGWATEQGTRLGIWNCPSVQLNQQWTLNPEHTP